MFQYLLVPLDGTALAEEVLPMAASLARAFRAKVTLLHVLEENAPTRVHGQTHLTGPAEAGEYLRVVAGRFFPAGISVDWHVHERPTRNLAGGLLDHVQEMGPDLLVMRDHGRPRFRDWLYGNIAQQAYKGLDIPLFLHRPRPDRPNGFPFRRILGPLDFKPEHDRGREMAERLAVLGPTELRLLTVVADPGSLSGEKAVTGAYLPRSTEAILNLDLREAQKALTALRRELSSRGVKVEAVLARGRPEDLIVAQAREFQAEVIVMGAHGRAGTKAFWAGSVAAKVISRSETSLLLVPPAG